MEENKHRFYINKKFTRRKDGYYIRRDWDKENKKYNTLLAHRIVWENEFGIIPPFHDIHHKDNNPSNNSIENLECVSHSNHLKEHSKQQNRIDQLNKVRPLEWLKSEEGRKSVSEKGKEVWRKRSSKIIKCEHCGVEKSFKRWARFCCKKCYMKWRWKQRLN